VTDLKLGSGNLVGGDKWEKLPDKRKWFCHQPKISTHVGCVELESEPGHGSALGCSCLLYPGREGVFQAETLCLCLKGKYDCNKTLISQIRSTTLTTRLYNQAQASD